MTDAEDPVGDLPRQVDLATSRERRGPQRRGYFVDGPSRARQRLDLGDVLHRAQRAGHLGAARERGRRERVLEREHEAGPRPVADRDPAGAGHHARDDLHRILVLAPRPHHEIGPRLDARRLELGDHEHRLGVGYDHEHREPLERHRGVAGEPRQVGSDRAQQRVDAALHHALAHASPPLGVGHIAQVSAAPTPARARRA